MELIATVVRLQVQRSRLKALPAKVYDPAPLHQVPALEVGVRGCRGLLPDGTVLLDVHHANHPDTRQRRGANGVSLLTLAGYRRLRQAHGGHLVDGVAGESLLLDGELPVDGELVVETDGGRLPLVDLLPAPPCVEFTRFCLGRDGGPVDDDVRAALEALGGGARGCYATAVGTGVVRPGARVWRA